MWFRFDLDHENKLKYGVDIMAHIYKISHLSGIEYC